MFKILTTGKIMKIAEEAREASKKENLTQKEKEKEFFRLLLGRVAQAEQKNTLQQVLEEISRHQIAHRPITEAELLRAVVIPESFWRKLNKEIDSG